MGFLDRLFGTEPERTTRSTQPGSGDPRRRPNMTPPPAPGAGRSGDELAIERYRYLLRTAPPETIEQVHAEAFGRLTGAQRQQVLADLSAGLPAPERPRTDAPSVLARAATRAEYTSPGFLERTIGAHDRRGPSFGAMVGSSLLGTVAGYVIGSALVSAFVAPAVAFDAGSVPAETADAGADQGATGTGSSDAAAADPGIDAGFDFGGDFGGDFGF